MNLNKGIWYSEAARPLCNRKKGQIGNIEVEPEIVSDGQLSSICEYMFLNWKSELIGDFTLHNGLALVYSRLNGISYIITLDSSDFGIELASYSSINLINEARLFGLPIGKLEEALRKGEERRHLIEHKL